MAELTDEMITELAGWLFTIVPIPIAEYIAIPRHTHQMKLKPNYSWVLINMPPFIEWLQSADGLEAVENAMIERGYICTITAYRNDHYWCVLRSGSANVYESETAETKAEAVLLAAYKSMKKEAAQCPA